MAKGKVNVDGQFESLLSELRANKAIDLINGKTERIRILDLGCGRELRLLGKTSFQEKVGMDIDRPMVIPSDINWIEKDFLKEPTIEFPDMYFNVITLLAVIEHFDVEPGIKLLNEVYRLLGPGGLIVITTPSKWTSGLLNWMAEINFVSKKQIHDHKHYYTNNELKGILNTIGFVNVRSGKFEIFANQWLRANKAQPILESK